MRDRWQPVGILAGVLFAINAVVRLIVWQVGPKSDSKQITVGFVGLALVGLVMAGAGWRWGRRYPISRVTPDLCVAVAVACLLTVLVGPFFGGTRPFKEGAGLFFAEIFGLPNAGPTMVPVFMGSPPNPAVVAPISTTTTTFPNGTTVTTTLFTTRSLLPMQFAKRTSSI